LPLHIVENPNHIVLFDKETLISEAKGFQHCFRKEIEIKISINRDLALNRDTGDISINPIYSNIKLKDSNNVFLQFELRSSDHSCPI
jgi:hypothetical protein